MPSIVLRHVTVDFDHAHGDHFGPLDRVIASTTRLFEGEGERRGPTGRPEHEPPDRPNALDDLSLTIKDGETLSVLGPSGCGKTTLLKVIAGLIKPDAGEISYDNVPLKDIPMAERGIGMVFQNYALYPHMEAYDNIGFYDMIRKHPERIPERIRHVVEVMGVEIEPLLSRKPPTLSGGEQQRIAVARCIARDPKVFLFDEPLSNLDAKLRVETRLQLNRLLKYYRITSVYVTHDQTEAIALADRIAIMRAGKVEQIGTFQMLYDRPLNAFVAQFFGTPPMNLFRGTVWNEVWEGPGFQVRHIRPGLRQGQAVWLGIRPEHIAIVDEGIPAEIDMIEPLLPQQRQLLYLQIGHQRCIASAPIEYHAARGDTLCLRFPPDHLAFFDEKTGARIG